MKLHKQLLIAGDDTHLISEDIALNSHRPGRAVFNVKSDEPLKGIVQFSLGYEAQKLTPWFLGYIESSTQLDKKQQTITCRELPATLEKKLFLNLRHQTLAQVLTAISAKTGLAFVVDDNDMNSLTLPFFYSTGSGYHCMDNLGSMFGIENYFWQQQANGQVFVGNWANSFWANKSPEIGQQWFNKFGAGPRAKIPAMPRLRPGVFLKSLGYINSIRLQGSHMALTWGPSL